MTQLQKWATTMAVLTATVCMYAGDAEARICRCRGAWRNGVVGRTYVNTAPAQMSTTTTQPVMNDMNSSPTTQAPSAPTAPPPPADNSSAPAPAAGN